MSAVLAQWPWGIYLCPAININVPPHPVHSLTWEVQFILRPHQGSIDADSWGWHSHEMSSMVRCGLSTQGSCFYYYRRRQVYDVCVWAYMHAHLWKSEDAFVKQVFSIHLCVGSRDCLRSPCLLASHFTRHSSPAVSLALILILLWQLLPLAIVVRSLKPSHFLKAKKMHIC